MRPSIARFNVRRAHIPRAPLPQFKSLTYEQVQVLKPKTWKPSPSTTFHREKLRSTDFLDALPYPFAQHFYAPVSEDAIRSIANRHIGASINWGLAGHPQSCRGFLYYHIPPQSMPLAGSLRFRLTPDYDPTSGASPAVAFAAGTDLRIPNAGDLPWAFPAYKLARMAPVRDFMRAEGWNLPDPKASGTASWAENTQIIHALGQPFLVEFHMVSLRAWLLRIFPTPPLCARILMNFTDLDSKHHRSPYAGFGIMTIERRLPDGLLVTRLQKILSLTQVCANDNVERPVEGMTRPLRVAPILFKSAVKPTSPKYKGGEQTVRSTISHLPTMVP
ncbi:hypothetical protein B0H15DRAFT_857437 [Mycena belliarum]|uniref:Uncharacterized protein n=1 Tax=Mycena belliarum TaxID=1033014 RepID=A0AAD6TZR9_9AGAR|nr:hypothetical protein B0H15DRAFT_857437 [Mycena belliae]